MNPKKFFVKHSYYFFSMSLLISANFVNLKIDTPAIFISRQDQSINFNSSLYTYLNLGLKRLISSTLWISTILESDIDHYKKQDLNSWMFLRFKSISDLEPLFYENYAFGGPYLSIVKDDLPGASFIYNRGLEKYPDDFNLLRDAGFHFHFEVGDYKKSYLIYSKLKKNPAANLTIISNLARLEVNKGNIDAAFELLNNKLNELQDQNSFLAIKLKEHLYSLKAEKDLECLNNIKNDKKECSKIDFFKEPYILKNKIFYANHNWIPFKIKSGLPK